jgi:cyclohexanone monooxygenase
MIRLYSDTVANPDAGETIANFIRTKIAEIVEDERAAKLLQPSYPFLSERIVVDVDYFETYKRFNVTLVDIRSDPIREIVTDGLRTEQNLFEFDALVLATGFDARTGSVAKIDIRGREGLSLKEKWAEGLKKYLGLIVAGFPNPFSIAGVGTQLSNAMNTIEMLVNWIADSITHMDHDGLGLIEAEPAAEERWMAHCSDLVKGTAVTETDSWWNKANIPGKLRCLLMYPGSMPAYRKSCADAAANGYDGLRFTKK